MSLEDLTIDESTPEGETILAFNERRLERFRNRKVERRPSRQKYTEVKISQLDRIEMKLDLLLRKQVK